MGASRQTGAAAPGRGSVPHDGRQAHGECVTEDVCSVSVCAANPKSQTRSGTTAPGPVGPSPVLTVPGGLRATLRAPLTPSTAGTTLDQQEALHGTGCPGLAMPLIGQGSDGSTGGLRQSRGAGARGNQRGWALALPGRHAGKKGHPEFSVTTGRPGGQGRKTLGTIRLLIKHLNS